MITIQNTSESTVVIKKSRFLGFAFRIQDEQHAQNILDQHKKQYHDARHNCFAYVLESGVMRYSDDGEPQGTAGIPILEVLKRSGLINVLIICTRYFGGILLGAGGLVRAYTQSASDTLDAAQKVQIILCSVYTCSFSYNTWAKAQKRLLDAGYMLDDVAYSDNVTATVAAIDGTQQKLSELITNLSSGQSGLYSVGKRNIEKPI